MKRSVAVGERRMSTLVVIAAVVLAAAPTPGRAMISSVRVSPESPSDEDPIRVDVSGSFGDGCWRLQELECGAPDSGQIAVDVFALDEWQPEFECLTVVIPYGCACEYDPLPVGHYVLIVTEHHASLRDPLPDRAVAEFDVHSATAMSELSWARIRALYR